MSRPSSRASTIPSSPRVHMNLATLHPLGESEGPEAGPSSRPYAPSQSNTNNDEDEDVLDPFAIDPNYRLRTTQTAHSVLAESIRLDDKKERRRRRRTRLFDGIRRMPTMVHRGGGQLKESVRKRALSEVPSISSRSRASTIGPVDQPLPSPSLPPPSEAESEPAPTKARPSFLDFLLGKRKRVAERRAVYVNLPLPRNLVNQHGDPIVRYVRNKVRTSKYTIITFLPKNLFEQFRRIANIYFLALVIFQLFQVFGAPNAQIGMLPLIAILGMTAIKDGIEDWRRAKLDEEVNTSATTKLERWKNVNQPKDSRSFFERIFGLGQAPGKTSKGVKKLRQLERDRGNQIVMETQKDLEEQEELSEVVVIDKEAFPMDTLPRVSVSSTDTDTDQIRPYPLVRKAQSAASVMSKRSIGVLDWNQPGPGSAQWERTLWKKLEVGDLVLLRDNEQVPADIIVLSTSNADNLCFVETKNLDGETNLKIRKALKATSAITSEEDLEHAKFMVDSEPPHANLYNYNGVLRYTPADRDKADTKQEAITINELLLRGCSIRNTKWVIGMVLFTGDDTKIMLNGGDTPSKRSKIERETNFNVAMNFVILLVMCLLTAILHGWYRSLSGTSADYYEQDSEASNNIYLDSVVIFFSCLIVFQNIVPISLYITIEIVKTIQAFFIFQDVEMYYEPYDTPCVPKTWNISDDLGQIEYVFSDKTGTLTQNVMEFKKCSIQGVSFGEGLTEAMMGAAKRDGQEIGPAMEDQEVELEAAKEKMLVTMRKAFNNRYLREDKLTLVSPDLANHLADAHSSLHSHVVDFFRALAICHSVLSDAPEPSKPFVLDYKAESPDEAALVAAARDVGFPFVNRSSNRVDIEVLGRPERWTPLRVLEFNSTRKRMSVIARDPEGRIVLFCKGADSVIYERLAKDHDEELKQSTLKDLETFANGGLRTLCISQRYLEEQEFNEWSQTYDAACAAVTDREGEIEKACELIEHSLYIVGATALEDKLQEGVPDSIATLHKAGIKLWILTGDKLQTAIEIGYSCNLLTNDMEVMIISTDSAEGARAQIEAGINKIISVRGAPETNRKGKKTRPQPNLSGPTFAVVIDGESLRYALQPELKALFLELGTQCAAVICCRVSPSQKALTVRLVKEGCNAMTLAIGDGANDVAMIQEANVGVGLYGLEGSQAAMSADYAFGQFRFLTRLLLVHGRWSYVRIADMHANFFYKNIIWTVSMFWYMLFNSFDATYLFEYTFLLCYNLIFTSLPVGILGAFDQDVNARAAMAFPQLYKRGIQGLEYTRLRFWVYMLDGLYQSAMLFFIPYLAYGIGTTWSHNALDTNGLYDFGTTIAVAGVIAANSYIGINTRYWTVIPAVITVVSTLLIFIWIPIYSSLAALPFSGEVAIIFPTFSFWTIVILTVFCCIGPRWLAVAFRQSYIPRDKEVVREAWITGTLKRELGVRKRREKRDKKKAERVSDLPLERSHSQLSITDGDERERYSYEPAAMASPYKDYSRTPAQTAPSSPTISRTGTGTGFSYPPSGPLLDFNSPGPSLRVRATSPPSFARQLSDPAQPSLSGLGPHNSNPASGSSTPMSPSSSGGSRASPSAVETFNLAQTEIDRLQRASIDMKRASLSNDRIEALSPRKRSSISGSNPGSGSSSPRRMSRDNGPPRKQASLPISGRWDALSSPGPGLSPVRASFDTQHSGSQSHHQQTHQYQYQHQQQEQTYPYQLDNSTDGYHSHSVAPRVSSPLGQASPDFSVESPWEDVGANGRRRSGDDSGWAV